MAARHVREFVVSNVVDIPLVNESLIQNPWGARNDFIDPATMSHSFTSTSVVFEYLAVNSWSIIPLSMCHHTACFVGNNILIGINTNE